jgi:ABC-type transport system involved in multi-copper enzyme maturation permease subunit
VNALPTIERELRAQARLGANYGMRVLGPAALLLVTFVVAADSGLVPNQGGKFFGVLNGALFLFIWLLVPLISADCISAERREGTIGLLFLTPLTAGDIVIAKGMTHGLRALVLWLAVLPVLTLPFLQGGVGWREAVLSAMTNFSCICCALAAGLLASSMSIRWLRAQVLACVLAFAFATVLVYAAGFVMLEVFRAAILPPGSGVEPHADVILAAGFQIVSDFQGDWGPAFAQSSRAGLGQPWLALGCAMVLGSLIVLRVTIAFAAWQLRRIWQGEPPSPRQKWVWEKMSTPIVGVSQLRRWLRRKLERNPIGWLETRSWTGRTVMWGWFATMVTFYAAGLSGEYSFGGFYHLQNLMGIVLLIGMAASAAGSFQRERETGVMELLLVSPMSEWKIIEGRMRGLWGQFLPAVLLLFCVWLYFNSWSPYRGPDLMQFVFMGFVVIPVIGLYFSLQRRNFLSAFLLTVATALLFPPGIGWALGYLFGGINYQPPFDANGYPDNTFIAGLTRWLASPSSVSVIQVVIAWMVGRRLYADLKHRNFAFSRSVT